MSYEIVAYQIADTTGWVLEPMERRREWMEQTPSKGANRCLPLVIANQAGWVLRCPGRFKARWDGKANNPVEFRNLAADVSHASALVSRIVNMCCQTTNLVDIVGQMSVMGDVAEVLAKFVADTMCIVFQPHSFFANMFVIACVGSAGKQSERDCYGR